MLQIAARDIARAAKLSELEAQDAADEAAHQDHLEALDGDNTVAEYEAVTAGIIADTQVRLLRKSGRFYNRSSGHEGERPGRGGMYGCLPLTQKPLVKIRS